MSMLQRRQQYKSRGTRQRMAAAKFVKRPGVGTTITRALPINTNMSANVFFKHARGLAKETGYADLASASYGCDTTGSVTLLNTVAQGAAVTQRVGKKIVMKGLQCRGHIAARSTAKMNNTAYMIVLDKRPTGALPNITDILNSISPNSMNNDANAGRFQILKRVDDLLLGNTNSTADMTDCTAKSQDWYLDLKGRGVTYKAAGTGAIGDIEEGALYLVTIGDQAAGTDAAYLTVGFRLRFVDV